MGYIWGFFWWWLTCAVFGMAGYLATLNPAAAIVPAMLGTFYAGITLLYLVNWIIYSVKRDA